MHAVTIKILNWCCVINGRFLFKSPCVGGRFVGVYFSLYIPAIEGVKDMTHLVYSFVTHFCGVVAASRRCARWWVLTPGGRCRSLREGRDMAVSERDRAVTAEQDACTKYEQLMQE